MSIAPGRRRQSRTSTPVESPTALPFQPVSASRALITAPASEPPKKFVQVPLNVCQLAIPVDPLYCQTKTDDAMSFQPCQASTGSLELRCRKN